MAHRKGSAKGILGHISQLVAFTQVLTKKGTSTTGELSFGMYHVHVRVVVSELSVRKRKEKGERRIKILKFSCLFFSAFLCASSTLGTFFT